MDNQKVDEVLKSYISQLDAIGAVPERHPPEKLLPTRMDHRYLPSINHARWMCTEALAWPASRFEKKMRWMSFIQGVLWMNNIVSIEEAKKDNMPKGEEYKP